ncbi:hypothetical protein N7510_009478 [Penicillium lagena]|uniref:uncharacterized protein n=1 Tax=Penicillium lagena TaxID=94218 RepID=UPI00254054C2|nr:uncharacterized protein N7510_009478 [Penicillium lagena]KAJ5606697.1 hypothetical protein N7510_009478 [Penicillium lagena]
MMPTADPAIGPSSTILHHIRTSDIDESRSGFSALLTTSAAAATRITHIPRPLLEDAIRDASVALNRICLLFCIALIHNASKDRAQGPDFSMHPLVLDLSAPHRYAS